MNSYTLSKTTHSLSILLGEAMTTSNLQVTVDYQQGDGPNDTVQRTKHITTNGTAAVPMIAGQTGGILHVNGITIPNVDTVAHTFFISRISTGETTSGLVNDLAVQPNETLCLGGGQWYVIDANGNRKTTSSGGIGALVKRTVLTSGTSFTPQPTTGIIVAKLVGGGGGGGGCTHLSSNAAAGGGGAAGGYAEKLFTAPGAGPFTYAIGAAGAAGANTGGTGGTGGTTTFAANSITVSALGGKGGVGCAFGTAVLAVLGGIGQLSTNGDVNGAGDAGENAIVLSGTVAVSGAGGSAALGGGGGGGLITEAAGNAAIALGGGGGGALSLGTAAQAGGAGGAGYIIVEEYS